MRVLILEDEFHAAKRLKVLIQDAIENVEFLAVIDSVEDAIDWIKYNNTPDLIFMDIQLADGLSFSIFKEVEVKAPIIFTTAYDQYTLQAFKVNSIDYLLKPIDEQELQQAILKLRSQLYSKSTFDYKPLNDLITRLGTQKNFKERFLLKNRDQYTFVLTDEVAYLYSEDSLTFIHTTTGKSHVYESTLQQLETELNPAKFFRINRKWIVNLQSIQSIHGYFNHRIKLDLLPAPKDEVIVSREKVRSFKEWLDG